MRPDAALPRKRAARIVPRMNSTLALRIAAISGFLAVALGAFGAHGLKATLDSHGTLTVWQTAALYHLVHSVVLLVLAQKERPARASFALFAAGVIVFSGSLYLLAVTNVKWLGAVTPIGGLCLLGGWLCLALRR